MKELIRHISSQLSTVYPAEEAEALAWWVVEETTGLSRSEIITGCKGTTNFPKVQEFCVKNDLCSHKNQVLAKKTTNLQDIIERLLHFEPIQYIFGHTLWNGLDMKVTPATLIPRPETAELVKQIAHGYWQMANDKSHIRVLDIGTGSGCIAIALKKAHPEWQVTGIDIYADAIEVAKENARRNNVEVDFYVADIFSKSLDSIGTFDIVVSNPPYICEKEKKEMRRNVLDYEPATALFVPDDDPLLFYRRIAELCKQWQMCKLAMVNEQRPLHLFFEINEAYAEEMKAMLAGLGYTDIQLTKDIYGKPRIIEGRMAG